MRRALELGVLFVCITLTGCLTTDADESVSFFNRLRHSGRPQGPDVVVIEVAILERPITDPFFVEPLWSGVDEQILGSELKALFSENGLRIGHLSGIVPAGLQKLLASEIANPQPRRMYLREGNPTTIVMRTKQSECRIRYQKSLDVHPEPVEYQQVAANFSITPFRCEDGRIRLRCHPQIEHGESQSYVPNNGNWALQGQRPTEEFKALEWDLTLAPNEYLIVGPTSNRPESLGEYLMTVDEPAPSRRCLVIRLGQGLKDTREPWDYNEPLIGNSRSKRALPIAAQANQTIARGVAP